MTWDEISFAGLDLPHGEGENALAGIVDGRARTRGVRPATTVGDPARYFSDNLFRLQNVSLFRDASPNRQRDIRTGCAHTVLREAYFVEKSGLAYYARMLLEAETTEARQAFAQIGGDEATHLAWIAPYVPGQERTGAHGPFLRLIADLIEGGEPSVLVYIMQVVLEGWGLSHYQTLADACIFEPLRQVFEAIRRDEAMHHKTGEVMLDSGSFGAKERALTLDAMACFLELVRAGPQGVMAIVSRVSGGLDGPALTMLHEQLSGTDTASEKLALLRQLMGASGMDWVAADLEERGLFAPLTPVAASRLAWSAC